jgi:uncharacterized membrane protein YesL
MLWQVIKLSAGRFYDHLGKCIWINLVWFFVSLTVVLFPPATAALFFYINETVRYEDPDTKRFFYALRRFFFRAWGLFLGQVLVVLGLVCAMAIYVHRLFDVIGQTAIVLAFVCFWMLMFFVASVGYMWVFLVYQDVGIWTAAKRGAILFFFQLFTTLALLVLGLLLFALNYFFALLPLTFFQMSLVAVIWNVAVLVALEEMPE